MIRQRTVKNKITSSGIGVHSGKQCTISLLPAPVDTGIIFVRTDLDPIVEIPAHANNVQDTKMCTGMEVNGIRVATVEHLMSALAGLGIDNLRIELNSPEVPIMDGSSAPFVYLIQQAGIQEQDSAKKFITINEVIEIKESDKWVRVEPFIGCRFDFSIEFNHPVFRHRNGNFSTILSTRNYISDICRARTFGFLRDIEFLHSNNLGLGGSLDNAVVVDDFRIMNEQGLRFEDEFVRHKLLDAIGDMYMLGFPILACYKGYKSGHDLNNKLCRKILSQPEKWICQELDSESKHFIDYDSANIFN